MAKKLWPDADPIGKQICYADWARPGSDQSPPRATIVGIVGNAHQFELREPLQPQLYVPMCQAPFIFATLVARTTVEPLSLSRAVQQAVWSVDPDQPMWKIRTMEFLLDRDLAYDRFVLGLMSLFAGLALGLTLIGIYGVVSYTVSQRTQEIGIRMALGAGRGQVMALVVRQGLRLAGLGIALGLAAALGLSRAVGSLLFGVSPTDPLTFAAVALLLGSVAALACVLPARRAARVESIAGPAMGVNPGRLLALCPGAGHRASVGPAESEPASVGPAKSEPAAVGPAKSEPAAVGPAESEPATAATRRLAARAARPSRNIRGTGGPRQGRRCSAFTPGLCSVA